MYQVKQKIFTDEQALRRKLCFWRFKNYKLVFTNGCFDILHPGHLEYLEQARRLGDLLLVAVNADDSVRKLKGEKRPINPISFRTHMLAALEFVDAIVVFEESTPEKLIATIRPHILVKGGDYAKEEIVGGKQVIKDGGEIIILPFVDNFSTTQWLENLNNVYYNF